MSSLCSPENTPIIIHVHNDDLTLARGTVSRSVRLEKLGQSHWTYKYALRGVENARKTSLGEGGRSEA